MAIVDQKVIGIKVNVDTGSFTDLKGNQLKIKTVLADNVIVAAKFEGRDSVTGVLGPIDFTQTGTPQYLRIQIRSEKRPDAAAILYAFQFNFNQNIWPDFEDLTIGQVTWALNYFSTELQTNFLADPNPINPIFSITYKSAAGQQSTLLQTGNEIGNLSDDGTTGLIPASLPDYITADEIRSQYLRRENNGFWAAIIDKDLTAAPGAPSNFDRYIVASPATGLWVGKEKNVAVWNSTSSAWEFFVPKEGWEAYVVDEGEMYQYLSAVWGIAPVAAHATQHQTGGSDEINVAALLGQLADAQPSEYQKNGSPVGAVRPKLNVIQGNNTVVTLTDDPGNDAMDLKIDVLDNNLNQDFDTSIVDADPGSGNMRFNNASSGATTEIFASDTDKDGLSVESQWDNMDVDDELIIRQVSDTSKNAKFKIDGATVSATLYSKLQVVAVDSNGSFDNGAELSLQIFQASGNGDMKGTTAGSNNRMMVYSDASGKNVKQPDAKITANSQIIGDALDPVSAQDLVTLNHFDNNSIPAVVADTTPQAGGAFDTNAFTMHESKGADVASATALPLIADGNTVDVTGTTTIVTMDSVGIGTVMKLRFDAILTITHNANIILPNAGGNILTAAGDHGIFVQTGASLWECLAYTRADGQALQAGASAGEVETNSVYEYSTTVTASDPGTGKIRFDSVTMGSITEMYISDNDRSTKDVGLAISLMATGMSLSLGDVGDSTGGATFQVDGDPVDNTGWWTVPVSHVDDATTGLTNTEEYGLQLVGGSGGGGIQFEWLFDTSTSMADPGSGDIRWNSATPASVTSIAISTTSTDNLVDTSSWLAALAIGDILYFRVVDDSADFISITLTAITDNTTWFQLDFTVDDSGTLPSTTNSIGVVFGFGVGAGSGDTTYVLETTKTASTSPSLVFDNLTDGSYRLEIEDMLPSDDNRQIWIEVSTDNGATWKTSGYDVNNLNYSGGTVQSSVNAANIGNELNQGNVADETSNWTVRFSNLASTTHPKTFYCSGSLSILTGAQFGFLVSGYWDGNDAIDAIRIKASTGNLASGVAKLYKEKIINGGGGGTITDWVSYTPTITGVGTPTSVLAKWRQVGDSKEIEGSFLAGTPTAVACLIDLPSGDTLDFAKISGSNQNLMGHWQRVQGTEFYTATGQMGYLFSDGTDTNSLFLSAKATSDGSMEKTTGSALFATGDGCVFRFTVPISGL